jgi:aryl-alcohol dehydrogenase-like predicted oxidoreductase
MEYRPLGRTGVSVSPMCLGTMMFGAFGNPDHDDAIRIIHRALDAGINFIDTADGYSAGESEQILGKALAGGRRARVVLGVKFGPPFDQDPNHRGASRRWIIEGVEGSLRRLGTDWIDLYQVVFPIRTPISTRPSAPCPTSCAPARSGTSGRRRSPPPGSSRRSGSPSGAVTATFAPNNPPTPC